MELSRYIDHTVLKPEAAGSDIETLCAEASDYNFASVCINPHWVRLASQLLDSNSSVAVCTVVGFPLGANLTATKCKEAELAIGDGATELDMVVNIGAVVAGDVAGYQRDITAVRAVAEGFILKVILETALIGLPAAATAAKVAADAGADFVKTSTGFNAAGGASIDAVRCLADAVGERARVKASGGIRDRVTALAMIEAGADRIGTSAGIKIVTAQE